MIRYFIPCLVLLMLWSCSSGPRTVQATLEDIMILPRMEKPAQRVSPCYDPLSYVAYPEWIRRKYIRVNFHFMNSADGRYNIPKEEVADYARQWIQSANDYLGQNTKMYLPRGNNTPVIDIPYRYVITPDPSIPGDDGIYYHTDDELCFVVKTGRDRNISDKRVIQKYAVRPDSIMNIFVQSHHLDSVKSPTYRPDASGISLGTSMKIFGRFNERPNPQGLKGITNHEIGHSLGLSHTWGGHDGCDDTPPHPNCWYFSDVPPCDTMASNNMMDYNAFMLVLTPCQIGKVLMNMARPGALQRNVLEPRWCRLDTSATITIRDSIRWDGSADLEGHVVIHSGGILEIGCRVSMPKDGTITIHPGGKLLVMSSGKIHNSCREQWGGIVLVKEKKITGTIQVMEGGLIEDTPQPLTVNP